MSASIPPMRCEPEHILVHADSAYFILSNRGVERPDLEVDKIQDKIDHEKFYYSTLSYRDAVRDMDNSFKDIVANHLDLDEEFVAAFTE